MAESGKRLAAELDFRDETWPALETGIWGYDEISNMRLSRENQTRIDPSGLFVNPRDTNNLERFVEREAFLRAATNVVPGFIDTLVETTQELLIDWLERHDRERYEVYSWRLAEDANGEWGSELRLDPPTHPLFLSVPRSELNKTFDFYDMVNGGAWRFAPSIMRFKRLNRVLREWASRFHIAEEWAIHAAQCAALVALPKLDRPFMVVMGAVPPVPVNYFDGPFSGSPTLDPTTATPDSEFQATALLSTPPSWNRRVESEEMYSTRLQVWKSQYLDQAKRLAAEKGERKIPRKRKRLFAPELRYTLAAEYQCNGKSFLHQEEEYKGAADLKDSSDPEIAIEQQIDRLFRLIKLKRRRRN